MADLESKLTVGNAAVTTIRYPSSPGDSGPSGPSGPRARLLLAHGAGANQRHAFMVRAARAIAASGIEVTTFNFLYTEQGRKAPDRGDALEQCFREVVTAEARRAAGPLFLGGKSMGGRIASQLVARGPLEADVRGLIFLGYPLHPPGKPQQLRVSHWPKVQVPQLFVQGTRDAFGSVEELQEHLPKLGAPSTVHVIEQGDHSFAVPKRAGVPQDQVLAQVFEAVSSWILARV